MLRRDHIIHAHQHHYGLDNARQPVLEVLPGETLTLETVDASGGQLSASSSAEDVRALDFSRVNPVTGPVRVLGAEPGDALQVELWEFKPGGWGWTANIPGFGLLKDFPDAHLKTWTFGEGKTATFADGIEVPLKAFPGTIGVAPAENGLYSVVSLRGAGRRRGMPHRYRITDGGDGAVGARQGCRSARAAV